MSHEGKPKFSQTEIDKMFGDMTKAKELRTVGKKESKAASGNDALISKLTRHQLGREIVAENTFRGTRTTMGCKVETGDPERQLVLFQDNTVYEVTAVCDTEEAKQDFRKEADPMRHPLEIETGSQSFAQAKERILEGYIILATNDTPKNAKSLNKLLDTSVRAAEQRKVDREKGRQIFSSHTSEVSKTLSDETITPNKVNMKKNQPQKRSSE